MLRPTLLVLLLALTLVLVLVLALVLGLVFTSARADATIAAVQCLLTY